MQRITITIDDDLLEAVDDLMKRRGYDSRSEAMRDIVRDRITRDRLADPAADCIGTLVFVFDHDVRSLAQRITTAHHDRHDLSIASMNVHLNHESCLQVSVLRGTLRDVQEFADSVSSQRGVRSAQLHLIPARTAEEEHRHGESIHRHTHLKF